MIKTVYCEIYAQERRGEPFVIKIEVIEDNWDFHKSCYQQYELNAWGRKINGERNLILSASGNQSLSASPKKLKDFIKEVKELGSKKRYKVLTKREYTSICKSYYFG